MSIACRVSFKGGSTNVTNENGTPSQLFEEALNFTNFDEQKAFDLWRVAYTTDFVKTFGAHKDTATLSDVLRYLDIKEIKGKRLTADQKNSIVSIMEHSRIESLSELSVALNKIFKSTGILGLDSDAAIASGLYTTEDLEALNLEDIREVLNNIEGELLKGDVYATPTLFPTKYRDTSRRNILGGSRIITEEQIHEEIKNSVKDFSNESSIDEAVNNLPYSEFVDKFNTNTTFRAKVVKNLSKYTRVPFKRFINGELVDSNSATYTTISNTLLDGIDTTGVRADASILANISPEVWSQKQEAIKEILQRIEKEQVENNIDIIGISEYSENQELVMNVLASLIEMVENPSEATITDFATQMDQTLPEVIDGVVMEIPEVYKGLSIFKLDSNEAPGTLFEQYGLIKVGDNLYHQVVKENISELYEFLYDQVIDGSLRIPTTTKEVAAQNKEQALRDIASYINSRETGIPSTENELISANQVVWNHLPLDNSIKSEQLADIKTNENYLKTNFISDFYKYILEEKLKGSDLYKDVLSKFSVTDGDIVLNSPLKTIDNLKYTEELKDYIRLKKDGSMKYLLPISSPTNRSTALEALNNPNSVQNYNGRIVRYGEFYVTKSNQAEFIKVNGTVYRQTISNNKASVYKKQPIKESIYSTTDATNYFNMKDAEEALKETSEEFSKEGSREAVREIPQYNAETENPLKEVDSCK